ncbi:MAG: GDSL-type esterase/lipase family protein [Cyanobacteria bacterium J06641_5]
MTLLSSLPPELASGSTLRLVALGDSLVYGYGDREGGGWVERLRRQWMAADSHVLYNLGVRGDRVARVLQRLEGEFRRRGELRDRQPDGLILSVGGNDSARLGHWRGRNFTEFGRFESQLAELLDLAKQLGPVWFVGMTPADETRMPFADCLYYTHSDRERYNQATAAACQERGIPFLNVAALWEGRGELWWQSRLCADGLHPNAAGYRALLQEVVAWDAFAPLMQATLPLQPLQSQQQSEGHLTAV